MGGKSLSLIVKGHFVFSFVVFSFADLLATTSEDIRNGQSPKCASARDAVLRKPSSGDASGRRVAAFSIAGSGLGERVFPLSLT